MIDEEDPIDEMPPIPKGFGARWSIERATRPGDFILYGPSPDDWSVRMRWMIGTYRECELERTYRMKLIYVARRKEWREGLQNEQA